MLPQVAMFSLWRNDSSRNLRARAMQLLSKTWPGLRWIWVVGDSSDSTYADLLTIANEIYPLRSIELIRHDSHIEGDDVATRRRRLSATANILFDRIRPTDHFVMIHESDLISPTNVVESMLFHASQGRCPIAGWPILPTGNGLEAVFYDIWAYRKDGTMFTNLPPFHECYVPDAPFEVDSFGSCWLFSAEDARSGQLQFGDSACLDVCAQLKARGRKLWVDPTLVIVQPKELWVPYSTD